MSDAAPVPAKNAAAKHKKPADHPPVTQMVRSAFSNLKDWKGNSLAANKKYVVTNTKVILSLDKKNYYTNKPISQLNVNGKMVHDDKDIANVYQALILKY